VEMQDPIVDRIVAHVERVGAHGVPAEARSAAKSFIADTLAVGVAGLSTPWRGEILDMLARIGGVGEATVFGSGERLPLVHAAILNAYQIHSQEFDCVHEAAVVHPMAAVLPVLLGWAEREGGVSGRSTASRHGRRGRCRGDIGFVLTSADALFSPS
jgi:aconitate decarboxylase